MKKIAVIGGGAAGLSAALAAAGNGADVTLLEKNPRVGKKILSTGNGRCNLTNINATVKDYNSDFAEAALTKLPPADVIAFFENLGLICRVESGGRVYPACGQASAVLDVLRMGLVRCGVTVCTDFEVSSVHKGAQCFEIISKTGGRCRADSVIIAAGGKAAPKTGSDGGGYKLLKALGHSLTPHITPSLTQILTDRGIQGVRAYGKVTLDDVHTAEGEIQFNAHSLSGIPVFNISKYAHKGGKISVDLLPEYSQEEAESMLKKRPEQTMETFLIGVVNKALGHMILKSSIDVPLSYNSGGLSGNDIEKIAKTLKNLEFDVCGTNSWDNAQVTSGGAELGEFDKNTLQSHIVPGLYAAGEILDIDAECGGYNLQWAWSSGVLAGGEASRV